MIQRLSPAVANTAPATVDAGRWQAPSPVPAAERMSALRFFLTAYAGGLAFFLAILL